MAALAIPAIAALGSFMNKQGSFDSLNGLASTPFALLDASSVLSNRLEGQKFGRMGVEIKPNTTALSQLKKEFAVAHDRKSVDSVLAKSPDDGDELDYWTRKATHQVLTAAAKYDITPTKQSFDSVLADFRKQPVADVKTEYAYLGALRVDASVLAAAKADDKSLNNLSQIEVARRLAGTVLVEQKALTRSALDNDSIALRGSDAPALYSVGTNFSFMPPSLFKLSNSPDKNLGIIEENNTRTEQKIPGLVASAAPAQVPAKAARVNLGAKS